MSTKQQLSRAELAAAGRRKLDEFRKAKAAGKAQSTSTSNSASATVPTQQKPADDNKPTTSSPPPPPAVVALPKAPDTTTTVRTQPPSTAPSSTTVLPSPIENKPITVSSPLKKQQEQQSISLGANANTTNKSLLEQQQNKPGPAETNSLTTSTLSIPTTSSDLPTRTELDNNNKQPSSTTAAAFLTSAEGNSRQPTTSYNLGADPYLSKKQPSSSAADEKTNITTSSSSIRQETVLKINTDIGKEEEENYFQDKKAEPQRPTPSFLPSFLSYPTANKQQEEKPFEKPSSSSSFAGKSEFVSNSYTALADTYDHRTTSSTNVQDQKQQDASSNKPASDFGFLLNNNNINNMDEPNSTKLSSLPQPLSRQLSNASEASVRTNTTDISVSVKSASVPVGGKEAAAGGKFQASSSRAQKEAFKELQLHIDELTQERFALQRALESQQALADRLAADNEALTKRVNQDSGASDAVLKENEELRRELIAKSAAALTAASQRDAYETVAREAQERQKALAAEVVALEEKLLKVRSEQLRNRTDATGASEVARAMRAQLEDASKERTELLRQLQTLRDENAELKSINTNSHRYNAHPTAATSSGLLLGGGSSQQLRYSDTGGSYNTADSAQPTSTRIALDILNSSTSTTTTIPEEGEEGDNNTGGVVGTVSSALIPVEIQALLPDGLLSLDKGTETLTLSLPSDGDAVHHDNTSMNPATTVSGGSSFAMGFSVETIFALLDALEAEKQRLVGDFNRQREDIVDLEQENKLLMGRLEAMQKRLELVVLQQQQQQ